jgi:hypothetical protein
VWRRDPGPTRWTDAPPTANPTTTPLVKELLVNPRIRWGQSAGWDAPGWAPLVDPGPRPLQTARQVGTWLWPTLAVSGFLLVTRFVLAHDNPQPGLSLRGVLTVALTAAVVALLTIRRGAGPGSLARAVFEYAVVFLLAVLVATTGVPIDQAPAASDTTASAAADQRPALVKTIDGLRDWLSQWRQWAREESDRRPRSPATAPTPTGEALPAPRPNRTGGLLP